MQPLRSDLATFFWLALLFVPLVPAVPAQGGGVAPVIETRRQKAFRLNEKGAGAYKEDRFDEAIKAFEEARRLEPATEVFSKNLARALHARAQKLANDEKYDKAVTDLRRALELEPSEEGFSLLLADVHRRREDRTQSRRVLEQALRRHASSSRLWEALGRLEYREEYLSECIECLEKAIRLEPERASVMEKFLAKVRREAKVEKGFFRDVKGNVTVKYDDRSFKDVGASVLELVDKTYGRLAQNFRHWPADRLTIILYTRRDYDVATGAHGWTGGLFDGKIRLPVRNYRSVSREVETTLAHELTHWFVRELCPSCPLWLNEGLAQIQEGKEVGIVTRKRVQAAHRAGRLKPVSKLPAKWASIKDRDVVSLYYEQSLAFSSFLVRRYGWTGVRELLLALKEKGVAAPAAFEGVFRRSLQAVEDDWRRGL